MNSRKPINIILCAGLNRSGSTWQFNVASRLLSRVKKRGVYGSWIGDYRPDDPRPLHVVKMHTVSDVASFSSECRCISSFRDVRAVAGSMVRMGWLPNVKADVLHFCDIYIGEYEVMASRSDYMMKYGDMLATPDRAIELVSKALDLRTTEEQRRKVLDGVQRLRPPASSPKGSMTDYDRKTNLHSGHIGEKSDAAAISRLSPAVLKAVNKKFHDWLSGRGFAL